MWELLLVCLLGIFLSSADDVLISRTLKDTPESCSADGLAGCGTETKSTLDLDKRLKEWLSNLKDKTFNFGCKMEAKNDIEEEADPIYQVVSCDEENSLWKYKYSGGKGPKKIFKGKGKLSFTKYQTPPHGYDYGMKSGLCLQIEENIKSIEGNFNEKGVLDGEAEVLYHDTNLVRGTFRQGVLNGMMRKYKDVLDPETNRPKTEKILSSVSSFINGKQVGPIWSFLENGMSIFDEQIVGKPNLIFVPYVEPPAPEEKKNDSLVLDDFDDTEKDFIRGQLNAFRVDNEEEVEKIEKEIILDEAPQIKIEREKIFDEIMFGNIDQDAMVINAITGDLTSVDFDASQCIMRVKATGRDETFDYDIETKARMGATKTKLSRFFDVVADAAFNLATRFQPLPVETLDLHEETKIMDKLKPLDVSRNIYTFKCPYDTEQTVRALIKDIKLDENGRFSGNVTMRMFSNVKSEDHYAFVNSTDPEVNEYLLFDQLTQTLLPSKRVQQIQGQLINGRFNGLVTILFFDASYIEGFAVDSFFHGIVRRFVKEFSEGGRRKRYTSTALELRTKKENSNLAGGSKISTVTEISSVGIFKNGLQDGPVWKFLVGGSFMYGIVKSDSALNFEIFSAEEGAYINADFLTGYVGKFDEGKMIVSQQAVVQGQTEIDQIRVPVMSEPTGRIFRHCPNSDGTFTEALVPDPLEAEWVYVNSSTAYPETGQGVFAKKKIPSLTVVAFFGGRFISMEDWKKMDVYEPIYSRKVEENKVVYLPDDVGKDLTKYGASLGHKINHSFLKQNCRFIEQFHPRFGVVPAAKTVLEIEENEEILCNYDLKFEDGSPWYQELWRKEIDHDNVEGPYGSRGTKKLAGEPITPMLVDSEVYKSFLVYATQELKLQPFA